MTINVTSNQPQRRAYKLPFYCKSKSGVTYSAIITDDLVICVTSDVINVFSRPSTALDGGYTEIDEFEFMEKYNATQERLSNIVSLISDMKKPENEIIESNGQIKHF